MKGIPLLAGLGLFLIIAVPAFCGTNSAIVGKWDTGKTEWRPGMPQHTYVFEFRKNGTATIYERFGRTLKPTGYKSGKQALFYYSVSGNKLTIIYPGTRNNVFQGLFKVHGDTLTTKILVFASRPNRQGQIHGGTMTRYKG